jgi:hypothetical protein
MLSDTEFSKIITDTSKRIEGDIVWSQDTDNSPAIEFRVEILSDEAYPLFMKGRYNAVAQKLSFSLIYKGIGRIYSLDIGREHVNPTGEQVGEKHKHRWQAQYRDKWAYKPADITALVNEPVQVWKQFCLEAQITHNGTMIIPSLQSLL